MRNKTRLYIAKLRLRATLGKDPMSHVTINTINPEIESGLDSDMNTVVRMTQQLQFKASEQLEALSRQRLNDFIYLLKNQAK